ncbi:hypothetical protein GIB67_041815 [Kingdonia uniflora]|uniref:Uncharacterized protein n=1 Tax=Kingdonia uniflora TaxID=39325 RepID=A0A7J7L5U1_9MAGN|nr:hypothetical protein GIB67_041815 [Kingdonia uniflora]
MRGRKVHDRIPVCGERYFEWFNLVLFSKLCLAVVNLDKNDDGRILGNGGAVGGGVSHREDVEGQNEDLCRLEEKISNLKSEVYSLKSVKELKDRARSKLLEAIKLKVGTHSPHLLNVLENIEMKKLLANLHLQLQKKVLECETLAAINENLIKQVVNQELHAVGTGGDAMRYKELDVQNLFVNIEVILARMDILGVKGIYGRFGAGMHKAIDI